MLVDSARWEMLLRKANPRKLRVAGSLKLGTVNVTDLLRALQGNGHPSTLAKAIAELGRIAKTLYLLNYTPFSTSLSVLLSTIEILALLFLVLHVTLSVESGSATMGVRFHR
jgi:hypothetical protein